MDLPIVTSTAPSCLLPAHEVVGPEVAQARPGCCQLRATVSSSLFKCQESLKWEHSK